MTAVPRWRVYGASCIGAVHERTGKPYEDAWRVHPRDARDRDAVAVAVSDGHGHARHFRSARGAQLAVSIATTLGSQLASDVRGLDDPEHVAAALRARAGTDLVAGWRSAVERDLRARPVTEAEKAAAGIESDPGIDDLVYAYGTTLMLVVAAAGWLMAAQIGDGDLFAIGAGGAIARLVDDDPRLDGLHTTSLCQPDALDAIRFGVFRLGPDAAGAVVLATDGYGNAQARRDWPSVFGADLAALAAAHGDGWIGDRMLAWVSACASDEGSGDDVTMAIMAIDGTSWLPGSNDPGGARLAAAEVLSGRRGRLGRYLTSRWTAALLGAGLTVLATALYALLR